jgi:hypothetical protein
MSKANLNIIKATKAVKKADAAKEFTEDKKEYYASIPLLEVELAEIAEEVKEAEPTNKEDSFDASSLLRPLSKVKKGEKKRVLFNVVKDLPNDKEKEIFENEVAPHKALKYLRALKRLITFNKNKKKVTKKIRVEEPVKLEFIYDGINRRPVLSKN